MSSCQVISLSWLPGVMCGKTWRALTRSVSSQCQNQLAIRTSYSSRLVSSGTCHQSTAAEMDLLRRGRSSWQFRPGQRRLLSQTDANGKRVQLERPTEAMWRNLALVCHFKKLHQVPTLFTKADSIPSLDTCHRFYSIADEIGAETLRNHCSELITAHWVPDFGQFWLFFALTNPFLLRMTLAFKTSKRWSLRCFTRCW